MVSLQNLNIKIMQRSVEREYFRILLIYQVSERTVTPRQVKCPAPPVRGPVRQNKGRSSHVHRSCMAPYRGRRVGRAGSAVTVVMVR